MQSNRHFFRILLIISDYLLLFGACRLAYVIRFGAEIFDPSYIPLFIIFGLSWVASSLYHDIYDINKLFSIRAYLNRFVPTLLGHLIIIVLCSYALKQADFSRYFMLSAYAAGIGSLILFRLVISRIYNSYQSRSYTNRNIVVVGKGKIATSLFNFFSEQEATVYRFIGDFESSKTASVGLLNAQIEELKDFCLKEHVNEIYFTIQLNSDEVVERLYEFADEHFIYLRIVSDIKLLQQKNIHVDFYGNVPIIQLRKEPLKFLANRIFKRGFDIAFSLLVILSLMPFLFPLFALLIKLESPGPVIFRQRRSGKKNREFICYKFRTMTVNEESDTTQAARQDPRLTKIGAFLRKTSLDEFPQFLNVLKGDMSVVGPRPHPLKMTEDYSKVIEKYMVRHFITPGVTGYAQINGYRGGTADPYLMQKRVEYDTWYLENWSLILDIKIIFLTVWNIMKGDENAY